MSPIEVPAETPVSSVDARAHSPGTGSATSPRERCEGSTMFTDMHDSTHRKTVMPEGAWLEQQLMFANIVIDAVKEHAPDAFVKSLGDGFLVFVPNSESTLAMIQIGIAIQEAIDQANTRVDGAMGAADFAVSVAITTGSALPVDLLGSRDYWGFVVDKAARLCSTASPNGIFADTATIAATNLTRIRSKVGVALRRQADEYVGPRERISVKGAPMPVEYHEIVWDRQPYGVRSNYVTTIMDTPPPASGTVASTGSEPKAAPSRGADRRVGTVKYYDATKGYGFLTASDGEDLFVAANLMVYPDDVVDLAPGATVTFVVTDASAPGKSRRASCVLVAGSYVEGTLTMPPGERPYGWIKVSGSDGTTVDVFVSQTDLPSDAVRGTELSFKVEISQRGPRAVDIQLASAATAA